MKKFLSIIIILFISHLQSFSQVAINNDQSIPDPSAMLDVKSLNKGFLPSLYELYLLYQQKNVVGGFSYSDYWSSTENNVGEAWSIYFYDGFQSNYAKDAPASVRPIRAF